MTTHWNMPFLMQLMVIEYFRSFHHKFKQSTSEEFDTDGINIITKIISDDNIGGSMRLIKRYIIISKFKSKKIYEKILY